MLFSISLWHKTCGGDTLVWVGFELLLRSRCVGISARRAEWFVRWVETVASSATIHVGTFEEGLGRIMFVAGALEHERPFLALLYKFLTMHPRNSIRRVPPYVSFILRYLAQEVSSRRHYVCGTKISSAECTPRVDAQASDSRTGIGGWFPALDKDGRISTWRSSWFSLEITKEDFPWVFEKGGPPLFGYFDTRGPCSGGCAQDQVRTGSRPRRDACPHRTIDNR